MIREEFKEISNEESEHQDNEKQPIKEEKLNDLDFTIGSDRNEENTYYIRGNPVSLYCTNIATLMGGRCNVWRGGRNRSGITDKYGYRINARVFNDAVAYNDGKLEFVTFSTMFHVIFQKSRRLMQAGGPFIFEFKENKHITTYINIDGEFYKISEVRKITIEKYFKDKPLRILVNEHESILK